MNHKRRRPKNRRAGCLLCKPHKMNGFGDNCTDRHNGQKLFHAREDLRQYFRTGD